MKKILIVLAIISLLFLVGCVNVEKSYGGNERFIEIYRHRDCGYRIYYDIETKVEYVAYAGQYFTVLVNADGTPYLYEGGK